LLGMVLAGFCLWLVRAESGLMTRITRTRLAVGLAWLFVIELLKSAWSVARTVVRPRMELAPGIIAYPLRVESDVGITLLANLITLTPGTLSVDVSEDRRYLYIHALDCSDPEALRQDIANGFERRIMEVFQ